MIVNIIGNSGENWDASYFAGSTGNAALMSFTKAIGGASLNDGVRVVGINPGPVATARMLKIMKRKAIDMLGDEARWEELYDRYPGKRPATARGGRRPDRLPGLAPRRLHHRHRRHHRRRHLRPRLGDLTCRTCWPATAISTAWRARRA